MMIRDDTVCSLITPCDVQIYLTAIFKFKKYWYSKHVLTYSMSLFIFVATASTNGFLEKEDNGTHHNSTFNQGGGPCSDWLRNLLIFSTGGRCLRPAPRLRHSPRGRPHGDRRARNQPFRWPKAARQSRTSSLPNAGDLLPRWPSVGRWCSRRQRVVRKGRTLVSYLSINAKSMRKYENISCDDRWQKNTKWTLPQVTT